MKRHLRIAPVAVAAALVLGACADDATDEVADPAADVEVTEEDMATMEEMETMEDMASEEPTAAASMDPAMAGPVGPGCADYASTVPDGEGSVEGMSDDPVAVAASNNPILTNLTAAVSGELNPDVDLVDTLNGDEFTVFAPVDDPSFAALDAATLETLSTDAELLRNVLTYHVVPGQIAPADLAGTTQTTVQGGTVEVTGKPDMLMVNGAQVICGGVTTANATVYLIDAVLMPAS